MRLTLVVSGYLLNAVSFLSNPKASAHGIIVPLLYTVDDAKKLVKSAKFPPLVCILGFLITVRVLSFTWQYMLEGFPS